MPISPRRSQPRLQPILRHESNLIPKIPHPFLFLPEIPPNQPLRQEHPTNLNRIHSITTLEQMPSYSKISIDHPIKSKT